ncbi:MAG: hypothetical protein ACSLE2_01565, partial [Lysobacterales bacterium]
MHVNLKRGLVPAVVATVAIMFAQGAIAQTNLDASMTVDNEFIAYISTDDTVAGTQIGSGNDWAVTEQFSTALTPGVTNYLHIQATDTGAPAMFIGEFTLDNAAFHFANGTQSLLSETTNWQVSSTGFGVNYVAPADLGADGTAPWGNIVNVADAAHFLWHPDGAAAAPVVYFSAEILASMVDIELTSIENTDDPVIAGSGTDNMSYTFTVTNNGPDSATNLVLQLTPDTDFAPTCGIVLSQGAMELGGVWNAGDLAASASATLTSNCTVNADVAHGSYFSETLSLTSVDQIDTDDTNDSSTEDSTIIRQSTFDVTKTWAGEGAGEVNVTLTCNGAEVSSGFTSGQSASFTLTGFADDTVCTIEEDVPTGFSPTYSAECAVDPVVSGTTYDCTVTNAASSARFEVTKAYSDGNDDEVEVMLSCNNGLPLEQTFMISEGSPVFFVITNFTHGEADCEVTETGTAEGYTPSYDNGTVVSSVSCAYDDIVSAEYICTISNAAEPASFTVTKDWVIEGAVGEEVLLEAQVTINCTSDILSIDGLEIIEPDGSVTAFRSGDGDSVTVAVDTELGPTSCAASESIFQTGVESESDCGSRSISAGGSSSCTITNTVFFEGIPTL